LRWMEQADEDFKTARILINQGVYYASVFFSHQAIEKALKSILLKHGKDPGKIHSLPELADMLESETDISIPENIRLAIQEVNPHYVITRYPDAANGIPARAYTQTKAKEILDKCKEVLEWSRLNLH
jgi:HEPN domain-containing protein